MLLCVAGDVFNHGILIKVENGDFAIVEAKFQAIEPEMIVQGMGVPRAGLGLAVAGDDAFDDVGPGIVAQGNLLHHADSPTGLIDICSKASHRGIIRQEIKSRKQKAETRRTGASGYSTGSMGIITNMKIASATARAIMAITICAVMSIVC